MGDTSEGSQSSPTDRNDVLLPLVRKLTECSTIDQVLEYVSHAVSELAALGKNDLPEDLCEGIIQLVRNPHSSAATFNALQAVDTIVSGPYNLPSKTRIISDVMPSINTILETPDDKETVEVCCEIIHQIFLLENVEKINIVDRNVILGNLLNLLKNSNEIDRETRILAIHPINQLTYHPTVLDEECIGLVFDLLATNPPLDPIRVCQCITCITNIHNAAKISLRNYIPDGVLLKIIELHSTYESVTNHLYRFRQLLN